MRRLVSRQKVRGCLSEEVTFEPRPDRRRRNATQRAGLTGERKAPEGGRAGCGAGAEAGRSARPERRVQSPGWGQPCMRLCRPGAPRQLALCQDACPRKRKWKSRREDRRGRIKATSPTRARTRTHTHTRAHTHSRAQSRDGEGYGENSPWLTSGKRT